MDFLVEPGPWSVAQEDDIRRAIVRGLSSLELEVWACVTLTTDSTLVE